MSDTSKGVDRAALNAGQSCRECRRRKGKCDGRTPVCSICQRYNRHCLYDKHSRSSLTRKHLTEVEERLEKAEALLRTFFTDAELSQMLVHGISGTDPQSSAPAALPGQDFDQRDPSEPLLRPGMMSPQNSFPGQQIRGQSISNAATLQDQSVAVAYLESPTASRSNIIEEEPAPLENQPAADDDFEWDERETDLSLTNAGQSGAMSAAACDAEVPRLTDGMATLTADDSNAGFLGSVSGSALLRLIWTGGGAATNPNTRTEQRRNLEQLYNQGTSEYPTSSSWFKAQPMLTRAMVDTLIDAYFALYHPTFPILHERSFREQYAKLSGRVSRSIWHTLANLVAALGSFVSSTCADDTHVTLFNSVKANLSVDSLETGSMTLVQAFAMAANYLQKRNRPNSGYNYGGIALRLAISLGLHKEFRGWQTAPFKKEMRRRVWWSLCVLDVGATVTYGRPLNWPQVGVDIPFPLNVHEKDLEPNATTSPAEATNATVYTYVRTQSAYHLHTIRIYNRLISTPIPSAAELTSLDDELIEGWLKTLPSYYNDSNLQLPNEYLLGHAISRWRFRIMRIIMYRPFLIRWAQDGLAGPTSAPLSPLSAEHLATQRCMKAAEECIAAIFEFWSSATHTRLAAWYVLYFLLQATLIPIHCLRRNSTHPDAQSWRSSILTALSIINAMNSLNPSAPKCRDIIHRLCGESLLSLKPRSHSQQALQPDPPWSPYTTDPIYGNQFNFQTADASDTGINPWMTEIDTAIDGYDAYVSRLSNAAMAGMGHIPGETTEATQTKGAFATTDQTQIPSGVQDWDWGLML